MNQNLTSSLKGTPSLKTPRRVLPRNAPHGSLTSRYKARRVFIECFEGQGKGKPKKRVLRHVTSCSPFRSPQAIRKWALRKFGALSTDCVVTVGKGHK